MTLSEDGMADCELIAVCIAYGRDDACLLVDAVVVVEFVVWERILQSGTIVDVEPSFLEEESIRSAPQGLDVIADVVVTRASRGIVGGVGGGVEIACGEAWSGDHGEGVVDVVVVMVVGG